MDSESDKLIGILARWQAARSRGERLTAETLCRDAPTLLADVRKQLDILERLTPAPPTRTGGSVMPSLDPDATGLQSAGRNLGGYRLIECVGRGGMGEVWRAADPALGREVAVKLMRPEFAAQPAARERFLREARLAATVEHPRVVPVYAVGEQDGVPYLVMPLLRGGSLDDHLAATPRPPTIAVLRIARDVAEGLAAAHAKGLVHRDVKPANVWLDGEDRRARLLDFGLARSAVADARLTQTGAVLGTPAYMAPEQARGEPADARSDLFSLGAILYQMVTGRSPFPGKSAAEIMAALLTARPAAPRDLDKAVPPALSDLVMDLLHPSPGERPASARDVIRRLDALAGSGETPIHPAERRNRVVPILALVVILVGVAGAAFALTRGTPPAEGVGPDTPAWRLSASSPQDSPAATPRKTVPGLGIGWRALAAASWEPRDPKAWLVVGLGFTLARSEARSRQEFSGVGVRLEFRPGDASAEGGLYLMGRYRVHLSGDPGNPKDPKFAPGAITGQVAASQTGLLRPGDWNLLEVAFSPPRTLKTFEPARVSVVLNGVATVKEAVLTKSAPDGTSDFGKTPPSSGPLVLRAHAGKLAFRNVTVKAD